MVDKVDNSLELSMTGITEMANYIIETLRFVVSLIMGGVLLVLLGKLINIMLTTPAVVIDEVTNTQPIESNDKVKEILKETTIDGWSSETITTLDPPDTATLSVRKIVKQPIKGSRRKAISVGPVMLTPNSHLKRSINVEDREERFHYDLIPPVPLDDAPIVPENVCVLVAIVWFHPFIILKLFNSISFYSYF